MRDNTGTLTTISDPAQLDALRRVRDALSAALRSSDAMRQLHHAVERSVRSSLSSELTSDVIGDIYSGTCAWDPAQVSLVPHVILEVRRRLGQLRQRNEACMPLSEMDEAETPCVEMPDPDMRDPVPADDGSPSRCVGAADLWLLCHALRRQFANAPDVLELLALYERGITRRRAVLLHMSPAQYRNARRRLIRCAFKTWESMRAVERTLAARRHRSADSAARRAA
jgi:hypothetical protein